jgi:cytochrome c oxidase cbb3-type subunit 1
MTAQPQIAPDDATPTGSAGRFPLLLLLGTGILWLLVAGLFGLVSDIQLHAPWFFAGCRVLTHGRVAALTETAWLYGWVGNAGLAISLWILSRLSGEPLRAGSLVVIGAAAWNAGLLVGLVGIASGDGTALPSLQLPGYALPVMLAGYGAMGVSGVLAWAGRRRSVMFASHWYAVAALFLFPWLFSAAQVMLLWAPVRGVLQAVADGWYTQGLWSLWLAPLALAGAYYVVPRITGKALPSYEAASLGFWCLVFVGPWTGGRHLIGGPVPAWIASIAIVASVTLLFHYLMVLINLRVSFGGGGGTALKFIACGVAAYVLGGAVDAVTSMRGVALLTQFTYFDAAQHQLALAGGISLMVFGAVYFAVPRLSGRAWASGSLMRGHLTLAVLGAALLVVSLGAAGLIQGAALNDAAVPFSDIADRTRTWLLLATAADVMILFGNLLLAANFIQTVASGYRASSEALAS